MEAAAVKSSFSGVGSDLHITEFFSRFFLQIFFVVLVFASTSYGLFEDQIGKFDWKHQYLGRVRVANFDAKSGSSPKTVFVATEHNVLAALNIKTGEILWRQVLEEPSSIESFSKHPVIDVAGTRGLVSLSGEVEHFVRCFDKTKGTLIWERLITSKRCSIKSSILVTKDFVVGVACSQAFAVKISTGELLWSLDLSAVSGESNSQWIGAVWDGDLGRGVVHFVGGFRDGIRVVGVLLDKGTVHVNHVVQNFAVDLEKCAVSANSVACHNPIAGKINVIPDLLNPQQFSAIDVSAPGGRLASLGSHSKLFSYLAHGQITIFDRTSKQIVPEQNAEEDMEFTDAAESVRYNEGSSETAEGNYIAVATHSSASSSQSVRWYTIKGEAKPDWTAQLHRHTQAAPFDLLFPFIFLKSDGSPSYRVLTIAKDDSLGLAQPTGKLLWERAEGLASVLAVEMLDLPLSEAQANIEKEFATDSEESIVSMLIQRLRTQAQQIQKSLLETGEDILGIVGLLEGLGWEGSAKILADSKKHASRSEKFERDYFNLHKVIVLSTKSGKIFGLDNQKGGLLWEIYVPELIPLSRIGAQGGALASEALPIFVQRTTAHFPHPAQCAALGRNKANGNGLLVVFDPDTGEVKEKKELAFPPGQAMLLPFTNDEEIHGLMITSSLDASSVMIYPNEAAIGERDTPLYVMRADKLNGELSGWKLESEAGRKGRSSPGGWDSRGRMVQVWNTNLPLSEGQILVDIVSKRASEKTHSQGKVMGDRSVLYKYVNPNLVVVAALSKSETSLQLSSSIAKGAIGNAGGLLTIFLVDAVTGRVLFSAQHQQAVGPVHLVNCENWLVYSHWNAKTRRTELSVWELYEGKAQSDGVRFSSFAPTVVPPSVLRQSYVFPQGLTALAVTDTDKGMANRHIMAAMPFGGVLEIPKSFLDPRRVMMPTPEQREEGLIPYIPELPIATEHILNYNQSVVRVRSIRSAPSGLESTSLVLVVGLDLYFTRLTPSGTFDILKDDFDHWLIAAVLAGLFVAMIVSKKIARHRDLKQAWK